MTNTYSELNRQSRQKVLTFCSELSNIEMECSMPAGWTVSGVLVHLAFWDLRAYTLLNLWQESGIGASPIDTDVANESMRVICCSFPPQKAIRLFLESAQKIDSLIDLLTPEFLASVEQNGKTVHLDRSEHRECHLEEIQTAIENRLK